ncbi:MAG: hypothetical protein QM796_02660 [Chthoniobacteraceae bacterium]
MKNWIKQIRERGLARSTWKTQWLSSGAAFYCTAIMALGLSACGSNEPTDQAGLNACYEQEFDEAPPLGVHVLNAKIVGVADAAGGYYRFSATPTVVDALIARGFSSCPDYKFWAETGNPSEIKPTVPSWWPSPREGLTAFYYNEAWTKHAGAESSYAWLAVNKEKTLVYVCVRMSY